MAKKRNENRFVPLEKMSKKDKFLHILKLFGIVFAGYVGLIASVVTFVAVTGGFNPPYIPLDPAWHFSKNEYVIDGNKYISIDNEGNQIYDTNGNLVFVQEIDGDENPVFEFVMLDPMPADCTELDAEIKIVDSTNPNIPIIQLLEDENVKALDVEEDEPEGTFHFKYSVKIGSPIYIKPVQIEVDGKPVNASGWIRLIATQGQLQTESWVFVDVPIEKTIISLEDDSRFDIGTFENESGEEIECYNVYPNSNLKINASSIWPNTSSVNPSTSVPEKKGTTNFNLAKNVVYEISDEDIATIDENGNITIKRDKEGKTFNVKAYTISKYNQLDKLPSLQDFIDDPDRDPSQSPEQLYKKAINKICVYTNVINFKINEIEVQSITTGDKNWAMPQYEVFESGSIQFGREITLPNGTTRAMTSRDVVKNRYYANLILSDEADSGYISELMASIKVVAVYENGPASASTDAITNIYDAKINGNKVASASDYFYLENIDGTYKYVVKQYGQKDFYFLFYYTFLDGTVIYDYVQFKLGKTDIQDLYTQKAAIELIYDGTESKSFNLKNFSTLVSKVAGKTPTYTEVKYFVPAFNEIVWMENKNLDIVIDGEIYYGVSYPNDDDTYNYDILMPCDVGKTTMRAVVLKTLPIIENGEIVGYDYLRNNSGYIEWEFYSNPAVQIDIIRDVVFTKIEVISSENINEEPTTSDSQCDVYEEVYQGGKLTIRIKYDGNTEYIEGKIDFVAISDSNAATISNVDISVNEQITFDLNADSEGTKKYQFMYTSSEGESAYYTIGIKVLSTELVRMTIEDLNNQISVHFIEENDKVVDYAWNDLEIGLEMDSAKSIASYTLVAYEIPQNFDLSVLSKFVGKKPNDEIADLPENINTIAKFVNSLQISTSIIAIDNVGNANNDATITLGAKEFGYKYVSTGSVILVAESSNSIYSNPVLLTLSSPTVTTHYGIDYENPDLNSQEVYSQGELTSVDGVVTPAKSIVLYLEDANAITFVANVGGVDYDITGLMHFKFSNGTYLNGVYTSSISGATISDNYLLTLTDISRNISETIVSFTDFGYINPSFYTYNLKPDYICRNNYPSRVYYTPQYVDLFKDTIIITNHEFKSNEDAVRGNKLFLPDGYVDTVSELKTLYGYTDTLLNKFKYKDDISGSEYYHIYCNLTIASAKGDVQGSDVEYRVSGTKIKLSYFEEENPGAYVYFDAPAGYSLNTTIVTKPGISENFDYNNGEYHIELANSLNDGDSFDLLNLLQFSKVNGNYSVSITDLEFVITNQISDDLLFYKKNGQNGTLIEGYTEIDSDNNSGYLKQDEYDALTTAQKQNYPYCYFTKADDHGHIDENVVYYIESNGTFVVVENPEYINIGRYYQKVYSNQIFYGLVESYYEQIETYEVSSAFISKYYEKTFEYVLTTDEFYDEEKTYYEYKNGSYIEVLDLDEFSQVEGYFEKVDKYIPATKYSSAKTYYYKHNYAQIANYGDISRAYQKFVIDLQISKTGDIITSARLVVSEGIQEIANSIYLKFKLEVLITSTQNGTVTYTYPGFYYTFVFEGYNG